MFVYEFESVETDLSGYSLFGGVKLGFDAHREIIARRAADGWRYVGFVPTEQRSGTGHIDRMDLVFEKEQ